MHTIDIKETGEAHVEDPKVVHGNHSTFDLFRDFDSVSLVRSKDASTKTIFRSVGQLDGLFHTFVTLDQSDRCEHYHKTTSVSDQPTLYTRKNLE